MAEAKPGQRVADRYGHRGIIQAVRRNEVTVKWDGGGETKVIASQLHRIEGPRWGRYILTALLLAVLVAAVFLR